MPAAIARARTDLMKAGPVATRRARAAFNVVAERSPANAARRLAPPAPPSPPSETIVDAFPALGAVERHYPAGCEIVEQWQISREIRVIVQGWAIQYELLENGTRQIFDFLLPGSIAGFLPDGEGEVRSPCGVRALTAVRACSVSSAVLLDAAQSNPALALWFATISSTSHFRSFRRLTLIGRRTARERVAALLLELYCAVRRWSRCSHLPRGDVISLPLSQEHIGDALGLTAVHVNRMLRGLREERVLAFKRGILHILDLERLIEIAGCADHLAVHRSDRYPLAFGAERTQEERRVRQFRPGGSANLDR